MVLDPGTATLIATAIAAAAKGGGDYFANQKANKQSKRRAKEMRRETEGQMLQDAYQRDAELEAHRLSASNKRTKRKGQSLMDTAEIVRGALKI